MFYIKMVPRGRNLEMFKSSTQRYYAENLPQDLYTDKREESLAGKGDMEWRYGSTNDSL